MYRCILLLCYCNFVFSSIIAFVEVLFCIYYRLSSFWFLAYLFLLFLFFSSSPNLVFISFWCILVVIVIFLMLGSRNIASSCWFDLLCLMLQNCCCLGFWFTFEWLVLISLVLAFALTLVLVLVCLTKTYCFYFILFS